MKVVVILSSVFAASTGSNSTSGSEQRRLCTSLCVLQCSQSTRCLLHLPFPQTGESLSRVPLYTICFQDQAFLQDSQLAILDALASPSQQMRVQASWALANLSDALSVSNFKLSPSFYHQILSSASKALSDKDVVRENQQFELPALLWYVCMYCR